MRYEPRSFDDLAIGDRFESEQRILSPSDIGRFAQLSGDHTALHTDAAYAATTIHGGVIAHGALVLAIATGHAYAIGVFEGTIVAIRSLDAAFLRPVRPGDSLTTHFEVESLEPGDAEDRATALFRVQVVNQDGKRVLKGRWAMLMRRSQPGG